MNPKCLAAVDRIAAASAKHKTPWGVVPVNPDYATMCVEKGCQMLSVAADVRMHFDTNALGTFLCCQQVGLLMVGQPEGGVIVNIGDWAEVRPYLNYAAYFPSKGAVSAITRNMAVELGSRNPNVRVNAILPGPVMLPPDMSEADKQASTQATLVKREGTPEHIALAVLSFVDNDFITGAFLAVDGGRTVYAPE